MCCDLYPFVNLVWQWRWVPSSERLLCFCCCRHKCQAAALYLLLSKAVLTASLHGLLEAHYFVSYQPLTPVQSEGDPTISLWITCPLCVTRGQPALLSKTHTFLHWQVLFLRGTSGSVPLFLSTHKTAVKKLISQLWDLSWSSVAKKKMREKKSRTASRWSGISENSSSYFSTFPNLSANYISQAKSLTGATNFKSPLLPISWIVISLQFSTLYRGPCHSCLLLCVDGSTFYFHENVHILKLNNWTTRHCPRIRPVWLLLEWTIFTRWPFSSDFRLRRKWKIKTPKPPMC